MMQVRTVTEVFLKIQQVTVTMCVSAYVVPSLFHIICELILLFNSFINIII